MVAVANTIRSQISGAVVQPVKQAMENAQGGWKVRALQAGALAVSFLGGLGLGASFFMERHKNKIVADQSKAVLADYYRNQIAAQLGINPNRVSASDLELAAKVNPTLANAISKIDREKNSSNRASTMATGGALALGAGMIPGLSGATLAAAHLATSAVSGVAVKVFEADVLNTQDTMEYLNDKRIKRQPISAADIVMLRISQDEALQAQLKKVNGKAFHKMNEAEQKAVIVGMPMMADAMQVADKINAGMMTEQDALMMKPKGFAAREMVRRAQSREPVNVPTPANDRGDGFANMVTARRDAQTQVPAGAIA